LFSVNAAFVIFAETLLHCAVFVVTIQHWSVCMPKIQHWSVCMLKIQHYSIDVATMLYCSMFVETIRVVVCFAIENSFYAVIGEPRSVVETLRDLPTLLRHLFLRLFSGGEFSGGLD
jgi:hypothetical protein